MWCSFPHKSRLWSCTRRSRCGRSQVYYDASISIRLLFKSGYSMLSPLYMAEISPPELRGSLVALEQLSIVLGVVLGFWIGFFTRSIASSLSWRIPLGVQIIPGMLLCAGSLFLPSSPRLLVIKGQFDKAFKSLARLRMRSPAEAMVDPLLHVSNSISFHIIVLKLFLAA
jgi:MFS family permease